MAQYRDTSGRFISRARIAELEAAGIDIAQFAAQQKTELKKPKRVAKTGATGMEIEVDYKAFFIDRVGQIIGERLAKSLGRGVSKIRDHSRRSIKKEYERRRAVTQKIEERQAAGKKATKSQLQRLERRTSQPGQPPVAHNSGSRSIRNIQFGVIPSTLTGIVGPIILTSPSITNSVILGGKTVPQLLEEGGSALFTELRIGKQWTTIYDPSKKRNPKRFRKRHVRYAARPFMKPALDKAIAMNQIAKQFVGVMPAQLPYKELPSE